MYIFAKINVMTEDYYELCYEFERFKKRFNSIQRFLLSKIQYTISHDLYSTHKMFILLVFQIKFLFLAAEYSIYFGEPQENT